MKTYSVLRVSKCSPLIRGFKDPDSLFTVVDIYSAILPLEIDHITAQMCIFCAVMWSIKSKKT